MVYEDRRRTEKPGVNTFYRAYSLTFPGAMQIYWNKRKCLHKKRVELTQDWLGTPTWPRFHCFEAPIWPPYIVTCIRFIPCSGELFAFCLLKFTFILNLLIEEMKTPDISTYSRFIFFNKIFLSYNVSCTPV